MVDHFPSLIIKGIMENWEFKSAFHRIPVCIQAFNFHTFSLARECRAGVLWGFRGRRIDWWRSRVRSSTLKGRTGDALRASPISPIQGIPKFFSASRVCPLDSSPIFTPDRVDASSLSAFFREFKFLNFN